MIVEQIVTGALIDFVGYLNTREESITCGGHETVYALHDRFLEWAKLKNLEFGTKKNDFIQPDVINWEKSINKEI